MAAAGGQSGSAGRKGNFLRESQAKLSDQNQYRPSPTQNSVKRCEIVQGPPPRGQLTENVQILATDDWATASRPICPDNSDFHPIRSFSNSLDTKVK
jgi:hypothetical protein